MSTYLYVRGVTTVRPEFKEQLDKRFLWDRDNELIPWSQVDLGPQIKNLFVFQLLCAERGDYVPQSYGSGVKSFDGEESDSRMCYDEHGQFHFCFGGKWRDATYAAFVALMVLTCDEFLIEMDYTDPASSAGPTYDRTCWYSWDSKTIDVTKMREAIVQMDTDDKVDRAMRMWAYDLAADREPDDGHWPIPAKVVDSIKDVIDAPKGERILNADFGLSIEQMLDEDELRRRCIAMGINPALLDCDTDFAAAELVENIEEEMFLEYIQIERHKLLMKFNRRKKQRRQRCGMKRKR